MVLVVVLGAIVVWAMRFGPGAAERLSTSLAVAVLAGGFLAVALRNALRLQPPLGVDGAIWLFAGLVIAGVLFSRWDTVKDFVALASLLMLVYPGVQVLAVMDHARPLPTSGSDALPGRPVLTPDIYWFVLDGYGRADVLEDFGSDSQSHFLDQLAARGFHIDDFAVAPYPMSFLSIASTLSMDYLATEATDVSNEGDFYPISQGDNPVVATLKSWGYEFGLYPAPFWQGTQCTGHEDACLGFLPLDPAEWALLSMTVASPLLEERFWRADVQAERLNPVTAVQAVEDAGLDSPRFVLLHLINPHPPYYRLGPSCSLQDIPPDPIGQWGTRSEYVEAVNCLNAQLLLAIDRILEADPAAVVLLQGDHGPAHGTEGSLLDTSPEPWTAEEARTRLAVLNAMRLPPGCEPLTMSSVVNTFRVLLGCLTGNPAETLPPRTWVGTYGKSDLVEVEPPFN